MEILKSVGVFAVSSGILLSVFAYIGRSLIQTWLQADLEQHKDKLKSQSQRNHFKFEKIFEKQLEVIAELHQLSVIAGQAASYTVRMQSNVPEDEIPGLVEKVAKFKERYDLLNIWLDDKCCESIDKLLKQHSAFYSAVSIQQIRADGLGKGWTGEKLLELHTQVNKDLPAAQLSLRDAFQEILGSVKNQ